MKWIYKIFFYFTLILVLSVLAVYSIPVLIIFALFLLLILAAILCMQYIASTNETKKIRWKLGKWTIDVDVEDINVTGDDEDGVK